ncbi:MAG TPA: peptidoglycan DD-metalloendopeptidase family protein [Saprospiraceae bacterium]|nr:peptidoglycan DD-metalloendopeptidase family protein [Saprospiraceae bacterium]
MKSSNVKKGILLFTLLFSLFTSSFGQKDKKDLEAQRKALEAQIKSTTEVLEKTQKNKNKSLSQLKALNAQIKQREALLSTINSEIRAVDQQTNAQLKSKKEAEEDISDYESRLSYALRSAFIRSQLQPDWIYLLSSSSLSQLMIRWVYLRQYKNYVTRQLTALAVKREQHKALIAALKENKEEKTELLITEQKHKNEIQHEQKSKEAVVKDLSKQEKKLKNQLADTQAKKKKLDDEIARLIRDEGNKMNTAGLKEAPATKALNSQFASNKGKLPWPVSKGLITDRFGTHPHPLLKGVTIQNNGIDIQGEPGGSVKSLFNGTVSSVTKIPGYDYMVLVRHGLYFTVYSKLTDVSVKKGDEVTTGQVLGHLSSDEPELHLEIWQDKNKLDPEAWIKK